MSEMIKPIDKEEKEIKGKKNVKLDIKFIKSMETFSKIALMKKKKQKNLYFQNRNKET